MKRVRRVIIFLVLLIVLLFVNLFIFRQQIGRAVVKRTVAGLFRAANGTVSYERINGDIFSCPEIHNLLIVTGSDTIAISRLAVRYDLWALVRQKVVLAEVRISQPDVRIVQQSGEKVRAEKKRFRLPDITVRQLQVEKGRLSVNHRLRVDSIGMVMALHARGMGIQAELDSLGCWLVEQGLGVQKVRAKVGFDGDSIQVGNFLLFTGSSRLQGNVSLNLRTGAVSVEGAELTLALPEVLKVPGRLQLKGWAKKTGVKLAGRAEGSAEGLLFQDVRLPVLSGSFLLADSLLSMKIGGADTELGRAEINAQLNLVTFLFDARLEMDTVPVNRFVRSLPEFTLSAEVEVSGRLGVIAGLTGKEGVHAGDSMSIRLTGASPELGADTVQAMIDYWQQGVKLRQLVISGPAGRFHFDGQAGNGMLVARCQLSGFDLGVAGRFLNRRLNGRADGSLRLVMAGDSWLFDGLVRVNGFATDGVEVSSGLMQAELKGSGAIRAGIRSRLSGRLAVGGEGVKVGGIEWNWAQFVWTGPEFDLRFERDSVEFSALGDINFEASRLSALVRSLVFVNRGDTAVLADSCAIALQGDTLLISGVRLNVAEGTIELAARSVPGESPGIELHARQLNLSKVARIAGQRFELQGIADLDIEGSDTLNAQLSITDLMLTDARVNLKMLSGALKITRDDIIINFIKFVHRIDTSSVSGIISYSRQPRLNISSASLSLKIADPGVWVLGVTMPYVEVREGALFADIQVNWNPDRLIFSGRARVNDAVLTVPSVAAEVERVQAELTLLKNRIVLEKLSGVTTKGVLTAEGFTELRSDWRCESLRYQTHFTGVSAIPIPSVYAIGSGEIAVFWRAGERALISGEARIDDALVTIGFGGQPAGGGDNGSAVNYDLHIVGDRGIWLRNPQADIELGVDLNIRMVGEEVLYAGEMSSRQGVIYYLDHMLRLTTGRLTFDNVSGFNPQLDLKAELPVSGRRNNGPDKIVLRVTGSLQEPSFVFSAEPPVWDETQIITYLSLNVTMEELSALEQKELLSRLLTQRVLGYFQTQVSKRVRDYISLDYLELETGITGRETARVTVGKYVTRNLYVSYTQSLAEEFQPAFRIEYYLNRRNELVAERAADGRYSLRYRLKLRF
ncbi:MAG: translocation/assembly module TamB domain-containing protein [candidate division WOR-3 bacterium]